MRHNFSCIEIEWIKANCKLARKPMAEAFNSRFNTNLSVDSISRVCKTRGWANGRKGEKAKAGDERIDQDGFTRVKIEGERVWAFKHRIEWERVNGPVPDGMRLKCMGDRSDPRPENWRLIISGTQRRFDRFGSFNELSYEVKESVLAFSQLQHTIERKRKKR